MGCVRTNSLRKNIPYFYLKTLKVTVCAPRLAKKSDRILRAFILIPYISPPALRHQQQVKRLEAVGIPFVKVVRWIEDVAADLFGEVAVGHDVLVAGQIEEGLVEDAYRQFGLDGISFCISDLQAYLPGIAKVIALLVQCGRDCSAAARD
jgi:hypothetical protein